MSLFSSRSRKRTNKPKSPLLLKVEEIDAKIDQLAALMLQSPRGSSGGRDQQPQHAQDFEPFTPFEPTTQEGTGEGNGV